MNGMPWLPAAVIAASYLIGSIPFSWFVGRIAAGKDIRSLGSGNVGATNVARTIGRLPGLLALLLDASKGSLAVVVTAAAFRSEAWPRGGDLLDTQTFWLGASAVAAVLGHMFPVWLRFQGGKGVATAAGVFLAIDPRAIAIVMVVFLLVWATTRIVSLASILAAAALPVTLRFVENQTFWVVLAGIVIATAVILKHKSNIARLAQGDEPRFPR